MPTALRAPVLLASLGLALLAWTLVWWALPLAQGIGTWLVGGQFIGLALPTWTQPWALVNEPNVGFAATRTALWSYWLSPFLVAVFLALGATQVPVGPSLARQLFLVHLSAAAAHLGLAWLPGLGLEDGLVAGITRFFRWPAKPTLWGGALAAGALACLPLRQLASYLFWQPQGPTPWRRFALWLAHSLLPAVAWTAAVGLTAPHLPRRSLTGLALAQLLVLMGLLTSRPGHPLRHRELAPASPWLAWAAVLVFSLPSFYLFSPAQGKPKGFLWGNERVTSNVRREIHRLYLTRLLAPAALPAPSGAGS